MTTEELAQLGNMIATKLEAEREQTRKLVREEVEAEGKRITRDQASKYLSLDVSLHEVRDGLKGVEIANARQENDLQEVKQGQKRLEEGQTELKQGLGQTNTILGKIKTVVETTEETVNNMDAGLTEVVKDHRERIEALEEEHRRNHKN